MTKKSETVQPKTGDTHRLFGVRTLKFHNIRDPKWKAMDKMLQYEGLTRLHEKNQKLSNLRETAERKKQYRTLRSLRKDVKDGGNNLKIALYGDVQRIKNVLQNHKDLQRLYQHMPAHIIVENMDQRTFVKRKELDRLIIRKNQLIKTYEKKLMELAKLQDRVKYLDENELTDNVKSKKLRTELKNSETRMRAIKTICRAYQTIIDTMMHDSIYFEPVLTALQDDIIEQNNFIGKTIGMGIPALDNLQQLTDEYENLEQQTRQDIQIQMADIMRHRAKITQNNEEVRKLVRRDSDFEIFPFRYDRETNSMTDLKNRMSEVEKVMKLVKKATSCSKAEDVYLRMKRQIQENERLENNLIRREKERNVLNQKDENAIVLKEALTYNLTPEEIQRNEDIAKLQKEINEQKKIQNDCDLHIKRRGEIVCGLRQAFQHIIDVLREVGTEHAPEKRQYPTEDLDLPLLKFAAFAPKAKPPSPFEEDAEALLKVAKDRIKLLMSKYQEVPKDELILAEKVYHKDILNDLVVEEMAAAEETGDAPLILTTVIDDPSIPNRKSIKAISKKIVELNAKKED